MIKKTKLASTGRIEEKLDELVAYYGELIEDLPSKTEFQSDRLTKRGIEKTIELIADTIVDISLLIISEKGFEKPDDSRGAISVLEQNAVLTKKTANQIKDLISFRNLLVHRYHKINEKQEYESIEDDKEDIILFVKEIETFLNS